MGFNAGLRFRAFCSKMKDKDVTAADIAETLGIEYNSMTSYYRTKEFSDTVIGKRLSRLSKYGVNLDYFTDPEQQDMFPKPEATTEQDEILRLILENTEKQLQLLQGNEELMKIIEQQNEFIDSAQKAIEERDKLITHLSNTIQNLTTKTKE